MDKFSLIKEFSRSIASTLELGELAKVINSFASAELKAENPSIIISDGKKYAGSVPRPRIFDAIEEQTFRYIMNVGKPLIISRPRDEYILEGIEGIGAFEFSITSLPLFTKNRLLGALNLYFAGNPDQEFADFLVLFAELSSSSIMNSIAYRSLEERSVTDKLTSLYNRARFDIEIACQIENCSAAKAPFSVMMIDIDMFKEYNDRNGHQKGDEALALIGRAILSLLDGKTLAFRYGGEEFAVIAPKLEPEDAFHLAEKIREKVESSCRMTVSIGLATCLNSSCKASAMIGEADSALYKAKRAGRNRVFSSVIIDKALSPIDVQAASEIGRKI